MQFLHVMPFQFPHAKIHLTLFSCCCNLHDNCSLLTRAAPQEPWGLALKLSHNPYLLGFKDMLCRTIQSWVRRKAWRECCAASPSVGGRASGLISLAAALWKNMLYWISPKVLLMCSKMVRTPEIFGPGGPNISIFGPPLKYLDLSTTLPAAASVQVG